MPSESTPDGRTALEGQPGRPGLAGHTKSWLSKIENGTMPLVKRPDIAALATALGVSADALLGEPAPEIHAGREAWNLTPLRAILLDAHPPVTRPDIPARPVALRCGTSNEQADAALRWSKYDTPSCRCCPR